MCFTSGWWLNDTAVQALNIPHVTNQIHKKDFIYNAFFFYLLFFIALHFVHNVGES